MPEIFLILLCLDLSNEFSLDQMDEEKEEEEDLGRHKKQKQQ